MSLDREYLSTVTTLHFLGLTGSFRLSGPTSAGRYRDPGTRGVEGRNRTHPTRRSGEGACQETKSNRSDARTLSSLRYARAEWPRYEAPGNYNVITQVTTLGPSPLPPATSRTNQRSSLWLNGSWHQACSSTDLGIEPIARRILVSSLR
jgi:hypothetical protein